MLKEQWVQHQGTSTSLLFILNLLIFLYINLLNFTIKQVPGAICIPNIPNNDLLMKNHAFSLKYLYILHAFLVSYAKPQAYIHAE